MLTRLPVPIALLLMPALARTQPRWAPALSVPSPEVGAVLAAEEGGRIAQAERPPPSAGRVAGSAAGLNLTKLG